VGLLLGLEALLLDERLVGAWFPDGLDWIEILKLMKGRS
jgi:hypothetical protein